MFSAKQSMPAGYIKNFQKMVRESNVDAIKELLRSAEANHYDLNAHDPKTKYTLLHFIISRTTENNEDEMLEILKLLKDLGCDLNKAAIDSFKNTPIHTASRRALAKITSWLSENGANKNVADTHNQTPLDYVQKQINSSGEHMTEETKNRLMKIKTLLKNEMAISQAVQQQVDYKNLYRLSLFAICVFAAGATILQQTNSNYKLF